MNHLSKVFILIVCVYSQIMAQETDLKKVYTDITTQINSSLLTQKGSFEINGSIFYDRLTTTYELLDDAELITETFQVDAGVSHFVMNNLSMGLLFSYLNVKSDFEGNSLANASLTYAGPLFKYYFGKDRWRPYIFTDYLFNSNDVGDQKGEFDLGAGILYHLTGNTGLTLQCKYGISVIEDGKDITQNRIFIGIGIANFIL
jgi:hypothetical protein